MGSNIISTPNNVTGSLADRPFPGIQRSYRLGLPALSSPRSVSSDDTRFPSNQAQVLAWDVVCRVKGGLSIILGRGALDNFFRLRRTWDYSGVEARIVSLSSAHALRGSKRTGCDLPAGQLWPLRGEDGVGLRIQGCQDR